MVTNKTFVTTAGHLNHCEPTEIKFLFYNQVWSSDTTLIGRFVTSYTSFCKPVIIIHIHSFSFFLNLN